MSGSATTQFEFGTPARGPVVWSDDDDQVLGGDLCAALAYATPAHGAVVTPVAPIGLRDRAQGTVTFTTSLGFGRKLERIDANPRVALAYHSREHGFAPGSRFVLVQGLASYEVDPDPTVLRETVMPASAKFMGPPKTGLFWDRWLSAYYAERVLVTVRVERVMAWSDLGCRDEPMIAGVPVCGQQLPSQQPPKKGTAPRVAVARAARRVRRLPHRLIAYLGADGYPVIAPVSVGDVGAEGLTLVGRLPGGDRRAGLLAHRYGRQLVGLESRLYTGWLHDRVYAPHTESGFRAPANKTLMLLANGLMAKRGLKASDTRGRER